MDAPWSGRISHIEAQINNMSLMYVAGGYTIQGRDGVVVHQIKKNGHNQI